jgi:hypothetical protein
MGWSRMRMRRLFRRRRQASSERRGEAPRPPHRIKPPGDCSEVDRPATCAYEPKRERVCTYVLRWRSNVTIMYHYVPRCNSTMQFLSSRVSLRASGGRAWTGPAARSGASTSDGPVSHWCRRVGLVWRGRCVTSMASRREITRLSEEQ